MTTCSVSFSASQADQFAQSIMNTVLGYAQNALIDTEQALATFTNVGGTYNVRTPNQLDNDIDFNRAIEALERVLALIPASPTLIDVSLDTPAPPDLAAVPDIESVTIADFTGTSPDLSLPTTPTFGEFIPPTKPEVSNPAPPTRAAYTMPTEPQLMDVSVPLPLALEIPSFDATLADEELLTPSNNFSYNEQDYSSVLLDALNSGLLDALQNSNYGLDQADEDLLFNRAREREQLASNQNIEEATRTFAASGFTIPPGAMQKAIERAQQDALNKTSGMNRELVLKRSDLHFEGKKFAYEQARLVEDMLITLHSAVMERTLNAAKAEAQVAIDYFNAQVAGYNARQQRFQILAQVFESRIRAELAKVELYKGQVQGAALSVEVNKSYVDLYQSQLEAIKTIVDTYRVDVQAYEIMMRVQQLQIDIYRAEVEAFVAEVQAKKAEFEAYEAAIRGEVAKVEAYKAEAQAYQASTEGKKAKIEALKTELEAYVEKNRAETDIFRAEAEVFNNVRGAQTAYNQNEISLYQARIQQFDAQARALVSAYELSSRNEESEYRQQTLALQTNVEQAKVELEQAIKTSEFILRKQEAKVGVYRTVAAGAFSAINCNASLSDSLSQNKSRSVSCNTNTNESTSNVTSTSNNTNTSNSTVDSTSNNINTNTSVSDSNSNSTVNSFSNSWSDSTARSDSVSRATTDSTSTSRAENNNYNNDTSFITQDSTSYSESHNHQYQE